MLLCISSATRSLNYVNITAAIINISKFNLCSIYLDPRAKPEDDRFLRTALSTVLFIVLRSFIGELHLKVPLDLRRSCWKISSPDNLLVRFGGPKSDYGLVFTINFDIFLLEFYSFLSKMPSTTNVVLSIIGCNLYFTPFNSITLFAYI